MPQILNPTYEAVIVQGVGRVDAGETVEVSGAVAAAFVDHPILRVIDDPAPAAAAPAAPEQVTVSVPAGEHVEIVPDPPAAPSQENAQ